MAHTILKYLDLVNKPGKKDNKLYHKDLSKTVVLLSMLNLYPK